MFLESFDNTRKTFRQGIAIFIVVSLLFLSSPLPVVIADEGGGDAPAAASSGEDQAGDGGSGGSGGSGGDTGSGGDGGDGGAPAGDAGEPGNSSGSEGGDGTDGAAGGDGLGENANETGGEEGAEGTQGIEGEAGDGSEDGAGGDDGADANEEQNEEGSEGTVVETGDAVSVTDVGNTVNTNVTNTTSGGGATSTEAALADESSQGSTTPPVAVKSASTTIENTNEGDVGNAGTTTAKTGDNVALAGAGNVLIDTGQAIAATNIINVVNTNIINSFGFLLLLSALFGGNSLDLRLLDFSSWLSSQPAETEAESVSPEDDPEHGNRPCSPRICGEGAGDLTVHSSSTARIANDVVVRAETGGNVAEAAGGSASVSTGNAYASANVVNVANTNIIDSNYLLLALNNFGDFSGDIVFPGIDFFTALLSGGGLIAPNTSVANNNTAAIENGVTVVAETGGNSASSTAAAVIDTGNAVADANVVNQVNTNLFGGSSLYVLLRVHGEWSGNIFGLPPGLAWSETPYGIEIYSTGAGGGNGPPKYQSLSANNTNNATINNNVEVYALTGENKVSASAGGALIETGDAYAAANVVNVANTNVIGQNWMLAIFNIFGNWSGNFSFGLPDLWVGGRAESPDSPLLPGSPVTYHFTVTNFGDAAATGVALINEYVGGLLTFPDGGDRWELGAIAPGESREVSYTGHVAENIDYGETPVSLHTTVVSNESDNNIEDNTESLSLVAFRQVVARGGSRGGPTSGGGLPYADIRLTKEASEEQAVASSTVDYLVTINNYGSSAYEAVLVDVLTDEAGNEIARQSWELGEVFPDEEITVTYSVEFNSETEAGVYRNEAQVLAMDTRSYESKQYSSANSPVAESTVEIIGALVLVEAPQCEQYLHSYLRENTRNDLDEVMKLQTFLREHGGYNVAVTGVFDGQTATAVRRFQERYATDILIPWGLSLGSGYVYYTTQKKINELYCGDDETFDLSPNQYAEIAAFRSLLERARSEGGALPDGSGVGRVEEDAVLAQEKYRPEEENDIDMPSRDLASVGAAVERGLGARVYKILSDAFGNITSFVHDENMFQSRR